MIYNKLNDNYDYDLHIHILQSESRSKKEYYTRRINMIRDIATARYVFIDVGTDILGRIHFREETQIVQLWHACGAFKKFGLSTADLLFGATRKEMERYPVYKYCSFVSVSSPEITWAYSEAMGIDESKIKPWGVSRTDVLFREDFRTAAKKKFELFMPSSRGKKVILFAPTFRGRVASAKTSVAFSIPLFFDALSDEYVLVIKHHPHIKRPPVIPKNYQQFAVDFTNVMDIEELLCVADICISDYSSLVFEYSLFEKPMLFFAYDLDEYFDWRGFYYNYEELTPGPVFKTNLEMIDYIKHIDERFDREKVIAFRNKFMSACDGHSTERIMKHVFGDSLENHIKIGAIEKMDVSHANDITLAEPDNHNTGLDTRSKLIENYPDIAGKKS
jgi:CDP-glycerol glycerophosphotransferase (TagB/SpsB family)